MIAHDFPPSASVGALRTLQFAKYLPDYGWEPVILTLKENYYRSVDISMLNDIPDPKNIYRTYSLESPKTQHTSKKNSRFQRTEKFIKSIIPAPDDSTGWLPFAFVKAIQLVKSKNISVIYTTSPPHSVHLIGYLLNKLLKKAWVVDFRDPWTNRVTYLYVPPTETRRKTQEYLEHTVLGFADRVITNTEPMKIDFIAKYPDINREKYITILNGYDAEDFANVNVTPFEKFTISYTGRLCFNQDFTKNPLYNPSHFLQAVKMLLDEHPQLREKIQVLLIGPGADKNSASQVIGKLNLYKVVKAIGPVSHKKSIQYLMGSHVLLLIHYSGKGSEAWIPAKTFEYIGSGRPILALAPKLGAAAELLRTLNCGIIVPPEDIEAIKEALLEMYQRYEAGCLKETTASAAESFDRRRLTKYLAEILTDLSK